jgi:hypothetical protein
MSSLLGPMSHAIVIDLSRIIVIYLIILHIVVLYHFRQLLLFLWLNVASVKLFYTILKGVGKSLNTYVAH